VPVGNPGDWVKRKDYPSAAAFAQRGGTVGFRVMVDRKGRVSGCEITLSSRWPDLDAATCELVTKRARFKPATDAKGKATDGYYSSRVHWMIPPLSADLI
jgi:periplasmic protein TonB